MKHWHSFLIYYFSIFNQIYFISNVTVFVVSRVALYLINVTQTKQVVKFKPKSQS